MGIPLFIFFCFNYTQGKTKTLYHGFPYMEPFNIKISIADCQITLTILPTSDYYKIVYYGGILGAITVVNSHWELVAPENLEAGDLPPYHNNTDDHRVEIELHHQNIQLIGEEIEKSHSIQDYSKTTF